MLSLMRWCGVSRYSMLNELNQSTVAAQVEVERECCALGKDE
jgi:hypothetical protein